MNPSDLERLIVTIRDQKVILDHDLASIYGVPTHRFNEAFTRNRRRFPADFAFQLTAQEFTALRAEDAVAQSQPPELKVDTTISSQIAMRSAKKRGAAYRPWAFTEHGALQAANILRSEHAAQMDSFARLTGGEQKRQKNPRNYTQPGGARKSKVEGRRSKIESKRRLMLVRSPGFSGPNRVRTRQ